MLGNLRRERLLAGLLGLLLVSGCAEDFAVHPVSPQAACTTPAKGQADAGAIKQELVTLLRGVRVYGHHCMVQGKPYDRCLLGVFDAKEATDSRLVLSDNVQLGFKALLDHALRRNLKGDGENLATVQLDDVVTFGFSNAEAANCVFTRLFLIKKMEAEAALAAFQPLADQYRAMPAKPAVTEEQRKFIVQANSMTQRKEFAKAMALYRKALDIDPLSFPAAYYNMALIASQQENIFGAILHMKKFMLLDPDAKDARSAQDKIYEWQALVGE